MTTFTLWLELDRATIVLLAGLHCQALAAGAVARRVAEQLELHELHELDRAAVP